MRGLAAGSEGTNGPEGFRQPLLRVVDRRADFPDPDENLRSQLRARRVAAAVLLHQALHALFQPVLAQAGPALVQVLTDLRAAHLVEFTVEVALHPVQHLSTR